MLCSCSDLLRNKSKDFSVPGKEKISSKTQTTGGVKQFYFNPSTGTYIPIAATTSGTLNTCLKFLLKYKVTLPGLKIRVCNQKLIFLFHVQNICCGYSKKVSPSAAYKGIMYPINSLLGLCRKIVLAEITRFLWDNKVDRIKQTTLLKFVAVF